MIVLVVEPVIELASGPANSPLVGRLPSLVPARAAVRAVERVVALAAKPSVAALVQERPPPLLVAEQAFGVKAVELVRAAVPEWESALLRAPWWSLPELRLSGRPGLNALAMAAAGRQRRKDR